MARRRRELGGMPLVPRCVFGGGALVGVLGGIWGILAALSDRPLLAPVAILEGATLGSIAGAILGLIAGLAALLPMTIARHIGHSGG